MQAWVARGNRAQFLLWCESTGERSAGRTILVDSLKENSCAAYGFWYRQSASE